MTDDEFQAQYGVKKKPVKNKYESLAEIKKLLEAGALTQDEYDVEKSLILNS